MAFDYSSLNLNEYMQDLNSPAANRTRRVPGVAFDAQYEVQTKNVIGSRLQVKDFIKISNTADAVGTITDGDDILVSLSLTPDNPNYNSKILPVPEMAVYQGLSAVGTLQIWPRAGSGITYGDYSFYSGFDYSAATDYNAPFRLVVENNSGGDKPIYIIGRLRYVMENDGQSSI